MNCFGILFGFIAMLSMSSKNAEQKKFMVMVKITDTCHFHKLNANIIIIVKVIRYWLFSAYWIERLEYELKILYEEKC